MRLRFQMHKLTRLTLMLTAVVVMTGCRVYEEQKAVLVRAIITPFVEAQRTTPLTQGTFRQASAVAPNNGSKPVETPARVVKASPVEVPAQPVMRPCEAAVSGLSVRRYRVIARATRHETVVGG